MENETIEVSGRKYILTKIPAFQAQKIAFVCMNALRTKDLSAIPDSVLWKLLSYVKATNGKGGEIALTSEELVEVNVPDAGALMTIELKELEYNFGFFFDGSLLKVLGGVFNRMAAATEKDEVATATDAS